MLEVVPHVVAAEWQHGKGVPADLTNLVGDDGRSYLGAYDRAQEHAVVPVPRLVYQRHSGRAPAAEQECRDRYSLGVFPFRCNAWTLVCRRSEAGIWMSEFLAFR